jgi:pyridoxamine 5'-phosphate oxidase
MQKPISDLREDYRLAALDESTVTDPQRANADPIKQFAIWFDEAQQAGLREPNAMTLATADIYARPSARIVLLKGFDSHGFCWFTNYESKKGVELQQNPVAALVFHWNELERQVRIEGTVVKMSEAESNAYFQSRPLSSRIGAWTSPQSQVIASRKILEERERLFATQFETDPPKPPHWGGYRLQPTLIEFWQGRTSRLHDRLAFRRTADLPWQLERLAP